MLVLCRYVACCALGALLALSCLGAATARAAMGGTSVEQMKLAGPYKLVLLIGPLERMYTQEQVKKSHPKSGEVMLRGTMVMGGMGMKGPMPNHHLELHVYNRTTGAVVPNAMVAITIYTPSGKMIARVPIAVMRGVGMGASDTHYGNNVALKDGQYRVVVQVEHTTATFTVTLGHTSMSM